MKFKEFWKRFLTLDRHHAEGFTLVELIVVIAILAILGGVAVPAYSGYVEKANMTADQTLVSEVADALTLYYYSHPDTESAYVILTPEGATADAAGEDAMAAVFGGSWTDTVALKYNEWTDDGLLGLAIEQGAATGATVTNSSFMQGSSVDELLTNVSDLTNSAFGFLAKKAPNMDEGIFYNSMQGNFSANPEEFNNLCKQYGIGVEEYGSGYKFADDVTETQLANLMVVAAAKDLTAYKDAPDTHTASAASELVVMYAGFAAAVNSPYATEDTKNAYNTMNAAFKNASSMEEIEAAMEVFAADPGFLAYSNPENENTIAASDSEAFLAIMEAVNSATENLDDPSAALSDADAYKSGAVANAFNSYVTAAAAVAKLDATALEALENAPDGSVVVFLFGTPSSCDVGATPAESLLR